MSGVVDTDLLDECVDQASKATDDGGRLGFGAGGLRSLLAGEGRQCDLDFAVRAWYAPVGVFVESCSDLAGLIGESDEFHEVKPDVTPGCKS